MGPPIPWPTRTSFNFPDLASFAEGLFTSGDAEYAEFDLGRDLELGSVDTIVTDSFRSGSTSSSAPLGDPFAVVMPSHTPKRHHTSESDIVVPLLPRSASSMSMTLLECDRYFELTEDGLGIVHVSAPSDKPCCLLRARTATTEKMYICQFADCRKEFGSKDKIIRHLRQEHTDIKPYRCVVVGCGHTSNDESNLASHVKVKHLMVRAPSRLRARARARADAPVQCNKCGLQFASRDEAVLHRHKARASTDPKR